MDLYSNKVRPILKNAKEYPAHFVGDLFAMAMMVPGAYTVAGWAYEAGRSVGRTMG